MLFSLKIDINCPAVSFMCVCIFSVTSICNKIDEQIINCVTNVHLISPVMKKRNY